MRFRRSPGARDIRLRPKIIAVLTSLVALWAFSAWVTVGEGWSLVQAGQRDELAGRPTKALINALQEERRLSLVTLTQPEPAGASGLIRQRRHTDQVIGEWRDSAGRAPGKVGKYVTQTSERLKALTTLRASLDTGSADRVRAQDVFNRAIDSGFRIVEINAQLDDQDIAADGRALIGLTRARELLSREDAFVAGALAGGRFGAAETTHFTELMGAQRLAMDDVRAQLPSADRARLDTMIAGPSYAALRATEKRLLTPPPQQKGQRGSVRPQPGVSVAQWQDVTGPVLAQMDRTIDTGGDALVERARPVAITVVLQLVLVAGLGLIAVLTSIWLAVTTSRTLLHQLTRLRIAAEELADHRLPDLMERLKRGEKVDIQAEAPGLEFGKDEIGRVGEAFNRVQITAIQAAVGQAELRTGYREILTNLARRTLSLVNRQLGLIDQMERRSNLEDRQVEDLFRLDHLTTRARRNAENLILLSGEQPTAGHRKLIPIFDVVRAAVGQVESYERAELHPINDQWLRGHAFDINRLLAELIENGLAYSAPNTKVVISGEKIPHGLAITIEDKGLGLTDDKLEQYNQLLADPPEFDQTSHTQLGLLVVAKIGSRYGIRTTLKRSAYGGVTAVVLLPNDVLATPEEASGHKPAGVPAVALSRHGPSTSGSHPTVTSHGTDVAVLTSPDFGPPALAVVPASAAPPSLRKESPPAEQPATATPGPSTPDPEDDWNEHTDGGLPVRRPQANLVPELQTDALPAEEKPDPAHDDGRSPEEIQRIIGSFQAGTQRGRVDAAARQDEPIATEDDGDL